MSPRTSPEGRECEAGAAVVWTLALVVVVLLSGLAAGTVAAVALARQRVATAADVAALAAAQALVDPCGDADRTARANGVVLMECARDGDDVLVTVSGSAPEVVSRVLGLLGGSAPDLVASARAGPP